MNLQVKFKHSGLADCEIQIHAKGFLAVAIYWASETARLPGWSAIAVLPIDPAGNAYLRFGGSRAIPKEATHVCARCVTVDFAQTEEVFVSIPEIYRPDEAEADTQTVAEFSVMSDLHLSGKPGRVLGALDRAESGTILIPGNLTNDGFAEQFALFQACLDEKAFGKKIFTVTGNHDQLHKMHQNQPESYQGYSAFQNNLLERLEKQGQLVEKGPSGAYAAMVQGVDIIGLQCVIGGRKIVFEDGLQLKWLEEHLNEAAADSWHVILCHAPLMAHNPQRNCGPAYLNRNNELQEIVDRHKRIIFISGHTHYSPNNLRNSVEYVPENQAIYIDDGSVTPTELGGEPLMPSEWKCGVVTELRIFKKSVEVLFRSAQTGICFPRGYYHIKEANGTSFCLAEEEGEIKYE